MNNNFERLAQDEPPVQADDTEADTEELHIPKAGDVIRVEMDIRVIAVERTSATLSLIDGEDMTTGTRIRLTFSG